MDAEKRLTKIHEWKVGQRYQWLKGGERGPVVECVGIRGTTVTLKEIVTGVEVRRNFAHWLNRWTKAK